MIQFVRLVVFLFAIPKRSIETNINLYLMQTHKHIKVITLFVDEYIVIFLFYKDVNKLAWYLIEDYLFREL